MSQQQQPSDNSNHNQTQAVSPPTKAGDDALMVHFTPVDYASWAREEREELLWQGKEAMLQSEVPNAVGSKREDESPADYAKRFADTMNDLMRRGVHILNDISTGDVAADIFSIDGHYFDVGPNSGITKKEYDEFGQVLDWEDVKYEDIPERFLKFETEDPEPDR